MAVMFQYDRYQRLFGIRRLGQLENPQARPLARFSLPKGATVHYMPLTETELGPSSSNPVVKAAQRIVFIDHVNDLLSKEGNPRPTFKLISPMMQQYRRENMLIRPLRDYDAASKDIINTVVVNYAMAGQLYRYQRSALSRWWTWKNMRNTLWEKCNQLRSEYERNQLVFFDVPATLPALTDLRKAERGMTPMLMRVFDTRERLDLLDIFIWLGESRGRSSMSRLDESRLNEITLVVRRNSGWLTINLGLLNSWRKASQVVSLESLNEGCEDDFDFEDAYDEYVSLEELNDHTPVSDIDVSLEAANGIDPKIMQVRFLKMLAKFVAKTNEVVEVGEDVSDEDSISDADAAEKEDLEEENIRILESTGAIHELVAHEEAGLAEELDEPAVLNDDVIMTDEDGELIIETAAKEEVVVQAVGVEDSGENLTDAIGKKSEELVQKKIFTAAQQRRMIKLADSYKTLKNPWTHEGTIETTMPVTNEDLVFSERDSYPDSDSIRDKSMLQSSIEKLDSQYVEKVLNKDILNAVMSVQKAGIAVTGYTIDPVKNAVSNYEIHSVQLTPVTGKPSTIRFRVPVVDKRGVYVSNGQRYRMRAQKSDVPIRKVNENRVALTSYYSKLFVERSTRGPYNYDRWLVKQIKDKGLNPDDNSVTDLKIANVAHYDVDLPSVYAVISSGVAGFESNGAYWFDYKHRDRARIFDMEIVNDYESSHRGMVVVGRRGKSYITVDKTDMFYLVDIEKDTTEEIGHIEDILGLDRSKEPVMMAEISIFGKVMPVGVALGYLLGFDKLVELLNAKYRTVPLGTRLQLTADEYAIRFLDETLVFDKTDVRNSLILSGYVFYGKYVKNFSHHSFNTKDVYFSVFDVNGIGLRYLRELDLMRAMWVDPITKGILEWMNEPTEYIPLLIRACELLTTRYVPSKIDSATGLIEGMERAKGYERIPGAIYGELVRSIRVYNSRSASANSQVMMKPHDVWTNIVQDPASALVDDINPIQNLKQKEIITYGGRGGRSGRSMTAEARLYKEQDIGFISESTVDSGDVAVITYMTPNANITSARGTVREFDKSDDGPSSIVSTSALISPFADRDDPKRVNFIGIQQSHVISTKGYRESPVSTGYDHVIAHRVDDIFALAASKAGEVVELSETHMAVANEDGTTEYIDLETQYGISAGSIYPQEQATTFKLGDKVKVGDILKYNPGFFKPSRFDRKQVQWMAGVLATTALMEASYTLEDSSAIDDWLSDQLSSEITKVKTITVRFDQTIRNLVKKGDHTDISTILCAIEDAVTADSGLFSADDLDTLRFMSASTPQAGAVGYVSDIEVFYHGDTDDMSDSLLELVTAHDKQRRKKARNLGQQPISGQVDQSLRIEGEGLELDHVAIKIYITHVEGMGVGDKAVFCNQMKTVVGHRLSGINETLSGRKVNAIFGAKSVMDRIVLSPILYGMTISVVTAIGERAAAMWIENDTK